MAKVVGMIGSASGKVGNLVYAVQNGIQTVRVYNPNVANPKSDGQTAHRAKFALAGRISGLMMPAAIMGMPGANLRAKRGAFVQNIVRKATSFDGNSAKIEPALISFAEGSQQVIERGYDISVTRSQVVSNRVDVTITISASAATSAQRPAGYGERLIVLAINTETSEYDFAKTMLATLPKGDIVSTTNTISFYIPVANQSNYSFYVYAVPFVAAALPTAGDYSFLGNDNGIVVKIGERILSTPIDYGKSVYEGVGTISSAVSSSSMPSEERSVKRK